MWSPANTGCNRPGANSSEAPSVEVVATLDACLEDTLAVIAACSTGPLVLSAMGDQGASGLLFALQERS
jgi:hypothetical protein